MKTTRLFWVAAILATLWLGGHATPAAAWSFDQLNPFQKKEKRASGPSTFEKLGTGTKRFFSNVADTLTFKKSASARKSPVQPRSPWVSNSKSPRTASKKSSWTNMFYRKEEPKVPETMDDWMSLESPRP